MRLLQLRLLGAWLTLGLVAGCGSPRTATQVIVVIDADDGVRASATNLHVEVFGGPAGMTFPDAPRADEDFPVAPGSGWPRTLALAPENRDATRLYRVVATGEMGPGGPPVAVARVISGYVAGSVRMVRLYLRSSCGPEECDDMETCGPEGRCVTASVPPEVLPEYQPDAGMSADVGPSDVPRMDAGDGGGADGGGADGGCPGGCDDGVACTVDACVMGTCQHTGCTDAPVDAGYDAGHDAGRDAGFDAPFDAGHDAGRDAGHDAGFDVGFDAGFDAGLDLPDGGWIGP